MYIIIIICSCLLWYCGFYLGKNSKGDFDGDLES